MNSGAWTESPAFYIVVNDRNMILKPFGDYIETEIDEPLNQKAIQAA